MFEKALLPTDFSRYVRKMLECIAEIPGLKEVILLHIIDSGNPMNLEKKGWNYDNLVNEAKSRLDEEAEYFGHLGAIHGLKVRPIIKMIIEPMSGADGVNLRWPEEKSDFGIIEGGSTGEAIVKTALEEKVPLIIIGAQGKGLLESVFLGSVSTEVLRNARNNLLIIRHKLLENKEGIGLEKLCQSLFSRILVTTDFSERSMDAVSFVKGMDGVPEVLLTYVTSKGIDMIEPAMKLKSIREDLQISGSRKVSVHVLEGKPSDEIISLAKNNGVSLIVIGSQGKVWTKQIRVGSTTLDVARRAECPVLVVRT